MGYKRKRGIEKDVLVFDLNRDVNGVPFMEVGEKGCLQVGPDLRGKVNKELFRKRHVCDIYGTLELPV